MSRRATPHDIRNHSPTGESARSIGNVIEIVPTVPSRLLCHVQHSSDFRPSLAVPTGRLHRNQFSPIEQPTNQVHID
jgi:hypothetical protein